MPLDWIQLDSDMDASVNFVAKSGDGGALEARFVQRDPSYFIVYLSSQTGCDQACRFCHLTQLRQTRMGQASIEDYHAQFTKVMEHARRAMGPAVRRMNINLMARGEPLLNPNLSGEFDAFARPIRDTAERLGIDYRFNISSIFPVGAGGLDLIRSFSGHPVTFYWSIYSLKPAFRRRWIPKADCPDRTVSRLRTWQEATGRDVVIHHALIEGENDRLCDHIEIRDFLRSSGLRARVNLVRYNSFSDRTGREASEASYRRALDILAPDMQVTTGSKSKIVPRVGLDVAASCGMFVA